METSSASSIRSRSPGAPGAAPAAADAATSFEYDGWGTLGIVTPLSFILLGIEEIGVEIEDPFGRSVSDLPLDRVCGVSEGDVDEIAGAIEEPARA